jgi:hypothetical protein
MRSVPASCGSCRTVGKSAVVRHAAQRCPRPGDRPQEWPATTRGRCQAAARTALKSAADGATPAAPPSPGPRGSRDTEQPSAARRTDATRSAHSMETQHAASACRRRRTSLCHHAGGCDGQNGRQRMNAVTSRPQTVHSVRFAYCSAHKEKDVHAMAARLQDLETTIGYRWSYLAHRLGHLVPVWQPQIGLCPQRPKGTVLLAQCHRCPWSAYSAPCPAVLWVQRAPGPAAPSPWLRCIERCDKADGWTDRHEPAPSPAACRRRCIPSRGQRRRPRCVRSGRRQGGALPGPPPRQTAPPPSCYLLR